MTSYEATDPNSYQATDEYIRTCLRRQCARCNHCHREYDRCIPSCDCPKHIAYTEAMIEAKIAEPLIY